jgi:hypothetical protein
LQYFIASTKQKKVPNTTPNINGVAVEQIKKLCDAEAPRLVEMYKDLHANPEYLLWK